MIKKIKLLPLKFIYFIKIRVGANKFLFKLADAKILFFEAYHYQSIRFYAQNLQQKFYLIKFFIRNLASKLMIYKMFFW